MHFTSATALLALSSVSVTYAAPFANDAAKRQDYSVVNVDGESTSAPSVETVTETISSLVTQSGSVSTVAPQTVTVTATPSSVPYSSSSRVPSSTPVSSHLAPPPGESFFPKNSFLRRGLSAAGNPLHYARDYSSPISSPAATATPSLAARQYSWSSSASSSATPSSVSSVSLIPRQWGWSPVSSSTYSGFSTATPSASSSLYARGYQVSSSSASVPTSSSSSSSSSSSYVLRRAYSTSVSSSVTGSTTPVSSWSVAPTSTPLY